MPLAFRSRFYDPADVVARDRRPWPHFDWMAVLRAQSCFEPGRGNRRFRTEREAMMVDPSPNEIEALEAASLKGGEFLDSLGKTDFALMSEEEWMTFLEIAVSGFQDRLAELHAPILSDEVPF